MLVFFATCTPNVDSCGVLKDDGEARSAYRIICPMNTRENQKSSHFHVPRLLYFDVARLLHVSSRPHRLSKETSFWLRFYLQRLKGK